MKKIQQTNIENKKMNGLSNRTMKELIPQLSFQEIAKELCKIKKVPKEYEEKVTRNLEVLLKEIEAMDPVKSDSILFVMERYYEEEMFYECVEYLWEDLEKWRDSPDFKIVIPSLSREEIFQLSLEECNDIFREFSFSSLPEAYCFLFCPRQETIGYQVNEYNAQKIGAVTYVVAFLNELTRYGFDEKATIARQKKLDRISEEMEMARELPPEEQEKYLIPREKVMERIGFVDERTEEEKEVDNLQWNRGNVADFMEKVKLLQNFWNISSYYLL